MNWLDHVILGLIALAAFHGFRRGFIIEVCSLVGLVAACWAAVHVNGYVGRRFHLDEESGPLSAFITFLLVIVLVGILGRLLTKAIDLAQLSLPNKLAGIVFGTVRMAFLAGVLLCCLPLAAGGRTFPEPAVCEGSALYTPLRGIAQLLIPVLRDSKWVKRTIEQVKEEAKAVAG